MKWFNEAAEKGYGRSQHNLGFAYREGRGVEQSDEEALKRYRRAALQGLSRSQVAAGMMYYMGKGTEPDEAEALRWFRLSARQGESVAKEVVELIERTRDLPSL